MAEKSITLAGSEIGAFADAVKELHEPKIVKVSSLGVDIHVLAHPMGVAVESVKPYLDEYLTAPERRRGVATVFDLQSFVLHVNRFKGKDSMLFAEPIRGNPKITAVFDYNEPGEDGEARFGEHRTVYPCPLSEEWVTWKNSNGRVMDQASFAEFIEANIVDVHDPDDAGDIVRDLVRKLDCTLASPSKLLDYSRGLQVRVSNRVINAVNLATGEATMNFESDHTDAAGQQLRVPGAFLLAIPVFRNGSPFKIAARLRYRVEGTVAKWHYKLFRAEETFDFAFTEACAQAQKETSLPLVYGKPEDVGDL